MQIESKRELKLAEREKFVNAFNDTMVKIWKERIILLDVIDTKRLLNSPISLGYKADGRLVVSSAMQMASTCA